MIGKAGRKAMEATRDGLRRRSLPARLGDRPGLAAAVAAAAALVAAGLLLYLRKRRQVAEHYTMGADEGAWESAGSARAEIVGA